MPKDVQTTETKLGAARTRLILDKPFLGALVLRLPMVAADPSWCKTTATDARKFFYNPQYIDTLSPDETQFMLAHEALHCALSHFARRQHRLKHRWDIACDYAVNPLLIDEGLTPPPGTLVQESFKGMTAEEIYPCLDDNMDDDTLDHHMYDRDYSQDTLGGQYESQGSVRGEGGEAKSRQERVRSDARPGVKADGERACQPQPLTLQEREALAVQWQQRLAGAAQQAIQAGKLGGAMARMVDFLLQPQLPWRMLLARYMSTVARDDYSFTRPSSRRGDPAIFPSLRSTHTNLVVVLDISGSVSETEIAEFLSEVDAIKGQIRARITLHACDAELAPNGPWVFEPWEDVKLPRAFIGGGGTSFVPVFEWVEALGSPPDLLVYFTDAEGEFPAQPPGYPVIWLVKGKARVPWGQRVQLN